MPFRIGSGQIIGAYNTDIDSLAERGMMVALVLAAEDIDLDAEPEEGKHGEVAAALDALTDAENKAEQAEKAAAQAREKAQEAEIRLSETMAAAQPGVDREEMMKIEVAVEAAREASDEAHRMERKAAKARAGEVFSTRHAEAVGAVKNSESV